VIQRPATNNHRAIQSQLWLCGARLPLTNEETMDKTHRQQILWNLLIIYAKRSEYIYLLAGHTGLSWFGNPYI
jgi:hypothetical protein